MELEAERANIEKGIARENIAEPTLNRDQIVFFLSRFQNGDLEDEAYRAMLIDTFLNSVFLYDDEDDPKKGKLVITLNYSGDNNKVTLPIMEKAMFDRGAECSSLAPFGAPLRVSLQDFSPVRTLCY